MSGKMKKTNNWQHTMTELATQALSDVILDPILENLCDSMHRFRSCLCSPNLVLWHILTFLSIPNESSLIFTFFSKITNDMILFYLIRQKRLNPKKTVIIVSNSLIFEMGVYKNWIRIFLTLLFNMFQILQHPSSKKCY